MLEALLEFIRWWPTCLDRFGANDCMTIAAAWFALLAEVLSGA